MTALAPAPARAPRGRPVLAAAVGVGVVAALLLVVFATRDPASTRAADSPLLGRAAPPLTGTVVWGPGAGQETTLAGSGGRWLLVNYFATWCVPCRREHPELVRFAQAHAVAGDASVVSVVFDDDPEEVADFFAEHGGDWPVIDDPVGRVALDWGVAGVPESYLVGPDGVVRAKIVGGVRADQLEAVLAEARQGGG